MIILTHVYPYTKYGENFFHEELNYLSQSFDKVIIIPCSRSAQHPIKREINFKNVEVIDIERENLYKEVLLQLIKIINTFSLKKEFKEIRSRNLIFNIGAYRQVLEYKINEQLLTKKIFNIILKNQIINYEDEVIVYSYWMSHLALVANNIKNLFPDYRIRTITRAHGSYDLFGNKELNGYIPMRKEILDEIDNVYSISKVGEEYLKENIYNSSKIQTSMLGTRDYGLKSAQSKGEFLIVSCSNLVKLKRVDKIIEALKNITNYKLDWVHFGDGVCKDELIELAEKNLPNNINYEFKGETDNRTIMEFYKLQSPSLFINVSSIEGIPVSIMEALSFGIPVIATDVGATAEIVNFENGYLLEKDFQIHDLTRIIMNFISMSQEDYINYIDASRKSWEEKCCAEKNYREFCNKIRGD